MAKGIEEIKLNLGTAQKAVEDEIEKVVRRFMEKLRTDADSEIRKGRMIYTGETIKNLRYEVTRQAGKITGVMGVGANVKHAIFAHEPTKPHFPPIQPIQDWVIKKGLIKQGGKATILKAIKGTKNADAKMKEARTIAFLIARKISRKGTKGLPFLRMALNLNREYLMAELAKIKK